MKQVIVIRSAAAGDRKGLGAARTSKARFNLTMNRFILVRILSRSIDLPADSSKKGQTPSLPFHIYSVALTAH
jgi:hypothetical protein